MRSDRSYRSDVALARRERARPPTSVPELLADRAWPVATGGMSAPESRLCLTIDGSRGRATAPGSDAGRRPAWLGLGRPSGLASSSQRAMHRARGSAAGWPSRPNWVPPFFSFFAFFLFAVCLDGLQN
jgi:hypothetical protein